MDTITVEAVLLAVEAGVEKALEIVFGEFNLQEVFAMNPKVLTALAYVVTKAVIKMFEEASQVVDIFHHHCLNRYFRFPMIEYRSATT